MKYKYSKLLINKMEKLISKSKKDKYQDQIKMDKMKFIVQHKMDNRLMGLKKNYLFLKNIKGIE